MSITWSKSIISMLSSSSSFGIGDRFRSVIEFSPCCFVFLIEVNNKQYHYQSITSNIAPNGSLRLIFGIIIYIAIAISVKQKHCLSSLTVMWLLKSAADTILQVSKHIVDQRTQTERLVDDIVLSESEIIPTNLLSKLAETSYDVNEFNVILQLLLDRLKVFTYAYKQAQINLNTLITINYLLKHGVSAFVDQLRACLVMFRKYRQLKSAVVYENDADLEELFQQRLEQIKERALHIETLLSDKHKLQVEKELSMLVRKKIIESRQNSKGRIVNIQGGQPSNSQPRNTFKGDLDDDDAKKRSEKLENFIETYLWRYVDKIDEGLDKITAKIEQKLEELGLGLDEQPEILNHMDPEDDQGKLASDEDIDNNSLVEETGEGAHKNVTKITQGFVNPQTPPQIGDNLIDTSPSTIDLLGSEPPTVTKQKVIEDLI